MPDLNISRINFVSVNDQELLDRITIAALEAYDDENVLFDSPWVGNKPLAKNSYSNRYKLRGKRLGHNEDSGNEHGRGVFLLGSSRANESVNVDIDRVIIEVDDLDMGDLQLTGFDEIAASVRENARIIAEQGDSRAFRLGILAARTGAATNIHAGGNVVQRIGSDLQSAWPISTTGADNLKIDVSTLARLMDEDNLPKDRVLFISPYLRQVATFDKTLFSRDYTGPDVARYGERFLGTMEGFKIILTNHLPSTEVTLDLPKYNGNFTAGAGSQRQPVALALASDGSDRVAIGKAVRRPLTAKVWESPDHDATRTTASIHYGMDIVFPPCAGEIGFATEA